MKKPPIVVHKKSRKMKFSAPNEQAESLAEEATESPAMGMQGLKRGGLLSHKPMAASGKHGHYMMPSTGRHGHKPM